MLPLDNINSYPNPFVANLGQLTRRNYKPHSTIWMGNHMQLTLMSIPVGGESGFQSHELDQLIYIEQGRGIAMFGENTDNLSNRTTVYRGYGIVVPAETWHNLRNNGNVPLKVYTVYSPPKLFE